MTAAFFGGGQGGTGTGPQGAEGKTAYQVAVDGGFVGTQAQWLASLDGADSTVPGPKGDAGPIGPKGADGAKGIKGDVGATGPKGAAGDKGDTGDQGIQGLKGNQGNQGNQGIQGIQGTAGIQGTIGDNGADGVKGDVGDTGPEGPQGNPGVSAYTVAVDGGFVGTEAQWVDSLKATYPEGDLADVASNDNTTHKVWTGNDFNRAIGFRYVSNAVVKRWDPAATYYNSSAVVVGNDGQLYKGAGGLVPAGTNPITDDGTNWVLASSAPPVKMAYHHYSETDQYHGNGTIAWHLNGTTFTNVGGFSVNSTANSEITIPGDGLFMITVGGGVSNISSFNGTVITGLQRNTGSGWQTVSAMTAHVVEIDGVGSKSGSASAVSAVLQLTTGDKIRVYSQSNVGMNTNNRSISIVRI